MFTKRKTKVSTSSSRLAAYDTEREFNVLKLFITCSSCQTFACRAGVVQNIASCAQTVIAVDLVKAVVIKPTRKQGTVVDI